MTTQLVPGISDVHLEQLYSDPLVLRTGDDAHPAVPIDHPHLSYISAFSDGGKFIGAYILIDFSDYECEAHCLLLNKSIPYSYDLARNFINFVFTTRPVLRLTGWIRDDLTMAVNHCKKYGFQIEGRKRSAVTVNGIKKDLIMVGITREDWERSNELYR